MVNQNFVISNYISELCEICEEFKVEYDKLNHDGYGDLFIIVLGAFGAIFFREFKNLDVDVVRKISLKLESGMNAPSELLADCVATGFVESVVNQCEASSTLCDDIIDSFGTVTRQYAEAYRSSSW